MPGLDLRATVGPLVLENPICLASGTAGHGAEMAAFLDLSLVGALVVKSLSADPWPGNPPPRLAPLPNGTGLLNSVGLQGPGMERWINDELPALAATGARVVVSIWGRSVEELGRAAAYLTGLPSCVIAVELNLSCPNLDRLEEPFCFSGEATSLAVSAVRRSCPLPIWVKLAPGTANLTAVARAATLAGADGLTLVNTLPGVVIDIEHRAPVLPGVSGGLSGPALHACAVRAVYECREALPDAAIIGTGGIMSGRDAVEMMMAGADAVQIGTASLVDPRAATRILGELLSWCEAHGVQAARDLVSAAHAVGGRRRVTAPLEAPAPGAIS